MIRRALFYLSILSFLGYGALLISHTSTAVGGSDSSGYANTAKMIAAGRVIQPIEALDRLDLPDRSDRVFIPLAYEPGPRPRTMVPQYPPGYPLHLAAVAILAGWAYAPHFVSPLAALLFVLVTYFLARELSLSRPFAFVSAAIVAGSAVLLSQAEQAMSDVVAALWATAAVLFALRSRRSAAWAIAAGAAMGMAVLVRPTNLILVVTLALALPWLPRPLALFVAGGLPFAAFEFRWNSALYGNPLRTGYSGLGLFRWGHFPARFPHYSRTLAEMFSPLVPLGWLAAGGDRRVPPRDRALLLMWFGSYLGLYCFWEPYEAWWYTRYLLPAFPAIVVAAVLVARDGLRLCAERSRRLAVAVAAFLLFSVVFAEVQGFRRWKPLDIAEGEKTYTLAMDLVRSNLPERSLVVSMQMSGSLRYYTDFTPVCWNWLQPGDFETIAARAKEKSYRIYALLVPWEVQTAASRAPGRWTFLARVRDVNLWQLE